MMDRVGVPVAVVGGGNIARAILRGAEESRALDPSGVVVIEPSARRRELLAGLAGTVTGDLAEGITWLKHAESPDRRGQLVLAVPPGDLERVGHDLRPLLGRARRVVVSLLAGTTSARVREHLGDEAAVVRAMPNIAVQVRHGVTAIARGSGAVEGDESEAVTLFSALGLVVTLPEEMMDGFTAVAGCGPGYVFMLADAMVRMAIDCGCDPGHAKRVVAATIIGSGHLLSRAKEPASELRQIVCTPGGMSAAAEEVFEQRGVFEGLTEGIRAACERGKEISS